MDEAAAHALKDSLRAEAKARRARIAPAEAEAAACAVRDRVIVAGFVPSGAAVSGYWPIGDEL
ncbi:MAG: 5-formyltetrahydrofolate cyclo-ligase, partial [Alphaproteobacteria bacterium]